MAQTSTEEISPAEALRAAARNCERFISGHGWVRPREALELLAEATGPEERSDSYGEGEIIESFEREVANALGTEAAVFAPSGTMVQQIALRIWCDRRARTTVAFHPMCHLETHEQKGYQALHGLRSTLVGEPHRLITLDDLLGVAEPMGALLLELPQRDIGGQLPAWADLVCQVEWAHEHGAAAHMDGARLWEATPHYERSYAEVAALFDSVYVSFYKGMGALAGAALAGPEDFIAEARVWIRRHGGNLIRLFPYVVSARTAMRDRLDRFPRYYRRARSLGAALASVPGVRVKPDPPQSNMMHVYLEGDADRLRQVAVEIARERGVLLFGWLEQAELPGYATFELNIGDAADSIGDEEVGELFTELMSRAAQATGVKTAESSVSSGIPGNE